MESSYKIEAFPVPTCCGAAILTGFGVDTLWSNHVESWGQADFDRLVKEFDAVVSGFENRTQPFAPHNFLRRDQYETPEEAAHLRRTVPSGYYSGGRSHLAAYLAESQLELWQEHLDRRGFTKTSEFKNRKSGRTVYVFSKTAGN